MNATHAHVHASSGLHEPCINPVHLERRLRHLVAETLGIDENELTLPISLGDDLAVDSLDLLELAVRIEETLDISIPDRLLAAVRTYGDLAALVVDRLRYPATVADQPVLMRVRITPPPSVPGRTAVRVVVLTPYATEMITEDARRTGQGTRVEMTVPDGNREPVLAALRATFAHLAASGIEVDVKRDERWHT